MDDLETDYFPNFLLIFVKWKNSLDDRITKVIKCLPNVH